MYSSEYKELLADKKKELGDLDKAKAAVLKFYQDNPPKCIFPAPLNDLPVSGDVIEKDPVTKKLSLGSGMLLRDDKGGKLPIFGNLIQSKEQQERLKLIMVN